MTEQTATGEVEQEEKATSSLSIKLEGMDFNITGYGPDTLMEDIERFIELCGIFPNTKVAPPTPEPTSPSQSGFMADVAAGKAEPMPEPTPAPEPASVLAEINRERVKQDAKWGGPQHDDTHVPEDWLSFISVRIAESRTHPHKYRQNMVEIAALAVAAIESDDRRNGLAANVSKGENKPIGLPPLGKFPDLRENLLVKNGPFILATNNAICYPDGAVVAEAQGAYEVTAICQALNNYNGLYSHAARLEARIAELEAAGVEDAEPVCTPETLKAWKSKMSTAIGPIELLKCFKVNALLSRVVAVAPEVAK